MALFTDEGWLGAEDLARYEAGLKEVLRQEGIEAEGKIGLAREEVGARVNRFLQLHWGDQGGGGYTGHVAVTKGLKHWVAMAALRMVFDDAYSQQLNDRYRQKRERYREACVEAEREYLRSGVAYVWKPVGRSGTPEVEVVVSEGSPGGILYVRTSWEVNGEEGAPCGVLAVKLEAGQAVVLRMGEWREGGWHVYAGLKEDGLTRQTDGPLEAAGSWSWSGGVLLNGEPVREGQEGDAVIVERQRLRRG